jgi:HK97 family phage prohead protease
VQTELEIKALNDAGEFEGWAARYGNVDSQNDRIEAGAFAGDNGRDVPILWAHKAELVAGVGRLEERAEGLYLKGRLLLDTADGRDAYSRLKAGAARGLSVGFRLLEKAVEGTLRRILKGTVAEVSLTAFPANSSALVTAVKANPGPTEALDRTLRPWNYLPRM